MAIIKEEIIKGLVSGKIIEDNVLKLNDIRIKYKNNDLNEIQNITDLMKLLNGYRKIYASNTVE